MQLRCHRCSAWLGEASSPMELIGIFKAAGDRECLPGPRSSWRCKGCGWTNVFRAVGGSEWRQLALKKKHRRVDATAGAG